MIWARFQCQRKEHLFMEDEQKPKNMNHIAHINHKRVGAEDTAVSRPKLAKQLQALGG